MKIIPFFLLAATALFAWHMSSGSDLDPALLRRAQDAARAQQGNMSNSKYLTVIDYRKSIFQTRLWVVDRQTNEVVLTSRLGHAFRSGLIYASSFSNAQGSEKSCTGSFVTGTTYRGSYGYSLRLKGLDPSNSNTLSRKIIIHAATAPWTLGCVATTAPTNTRLINLIKEGSFLYVAR